MVRARFKVRVRGVVRGGVKTIVRFRVGGRVSAHLSRPPQPSPPTTLSCIGGDHAFAERDGSHSVALSQMIIHAITQAFAMTIRMHNTKYSVLPRHLHVCVHVSQASSQLEGFTISLKCS